MQMLVSEPENRKLKGYLATRWLLSLDAEFSVICRNSAYGCCTCSLKVYRLTAFNVDRRLFFPTSDAGFCFKG